MGEIKVDTMTKGEIDKNKKLEVRKSKKRRVTYKDIAIIQSIVIASFITDKLLLNSFFNYNGAVQRVLTVVGCMLFFSVLIFNFCKLCLRQEER
jgi:hypothetical protein|nr:MAG TPA: hypothetical protein [Caudoviricetes sp.]